MNKNPNVVIAIVVSIAFVFIWDLMVVSRFRQKTQPIAHSTPVLPEKTNLVTPPKQSEKPQLEGNPFSTLELTTENQIVKIDSRGAGIKSWRLKERDHWIELILQKSSSRPLETWAAADFSAQKISNDEALFSSINADGLILEKRLKISDKGLHHISLRLTNPTTATQKHDLMFGWGGGLNKGIAKSPEDPVEDTHAAESRALVLVNSQVKSWKPGFIFQRVVDRIETGPFQWIAVDNNYFLAALIVREKPIPTVHIEASRQIPPTATIPFAVTLAPQESFEVSYDLYVGPKSREQLNLADRDLIKSVDFGFFGALAKVLIKALDGFYRFTGNYGWAIVLLTLCVQIVLLPLTLKSLKHSVRMKAVQPQIKKLQEQYKKDPKRLQIETFNLYKKHGMHLMGLEGCLPVLLQMPVFLAFYAALNVAFELRGAPWIFWIKDLSSADPYYVLPIIMGIGMYIQQKVSAVATDPMQAKMMMFMPVMFTFMFLKLPAGLVLYWCVNSICTILVQRVLAFRQSEQPSIT